MNEIKTPFIYLTITKNKKTTVEQPHNKGKR